MASSVVAWSETACLFAGLYLGIPLLGRALDGSVGWSPLPEAVRYAGGPLLVLGAAGLVWCFSLFVRIGRGTPNPLRPTQVLVTAGPFSWIRNPIMGSHFLAGLGIALLVASPGAIVVLGGLTIPSYFLALHEERGLEARFGEAYRAYAAEVPRFVPRPRRRQR